MYTKIGSKFKLLKSMLGNSAGVIGYVFHQYKDYDDSDEIAIEIIFSNGNYDGFSKREQSDFLEYQGYNLEYAGYIFQNVIQVSKDFRNGYWKFD